MRKFDKLYNLQKANILAEQRYLKEKDVLNESFHNPDGTPIGVDRYHRPIVKETDDLKRGDKIVWIAPPKEVSRLVRVMTGAKGEYLGREGGEEVVSFNGYNFYTSRGTFELSEDNSYELQEGSEGFGSVRLVNKNDFEKFIKSNPALGTIYDSENDRFKIYLYADLVGYFNPKLGRIDYEKNSRFAKVSDEYIWDRNINQ
jgi:hypothetical protein